MALVGLKNLYVAKVTETDGAVTYGAPVHIKGVIDAKVTSNVDSQNLNADDTVAEIITLTSSIDVEFTLNELNSENYALLLGKTKDSNGVIIDKGSDQSPYFALGFESQKSNGASRLIWLYKGRFLSVDQSYSTKTDKADFQTQPIKGTFIKNVDDKFGVRVDTDDTGIGATVKTNWFTAVYEEAAV